MRLQRGKAETGGGSDEVLASWNGAEWDAERDNGCLGETRTGSWGGPDKPAPQQSTTDWSKKNIRSDGIEDPATNE